MRSKSEIIILFFYQVFLTCCIDFANVRCKILTSLCTKNIIYYINICSRTILKIRFSRFWTQPNNRFMTSWKILFYIFLDHIWWFFKNSTVLNPISSHGISKKPKPKFWVTKHHYYIKGTRTRRGKGIWNNAMVCKSFRSRQ